MDAHTSPWLGRRVLVTDCSDPLGAAATSQLIARGAVVAGFVTDRRGSADLARHRDAGRFIALYGRPADVGRLRTAVAVHEADAVFHPAGAAEAVCRAVAGSARPVAVVVTRPAGELRLATPDAGPVAVARFGAVFGPGCFRPAAGGSARDHVFVRDAARAWVMVGEAALAGAPPDVTFRSGWQFADWEFAAALGGDAPERPPGPVDNPFGWSADTPLAVALAETAAWRLEASADARPTRRAA